MPSAMSSLPPGLTIGRSFASATSNVTASAETLAAEVPEPPIGPVALGVANAPTRFRLLVRRSSRRAASGSGVVDHKASDDAPRWRRGGDRTEARDKRNVRDTRPRRSVLCGFARAADLTEHKRIRRFWV